MSALKNPQAGLSDPRLSKALAASWSGRGLSVSADDWPGVVASGDGWRIVLPRNASGYRLQRKDSRAKWLPVYGLPADLRAWGARLAASCPDLASVAERLPVDPVDAVKALLVSQGVSLPQVRRRSDWLRADYPGVLRVDANMRSVRDAAGVLYAIQWVAPALLSSGNPLRWVTQAAGPSWSALVTDMARKTGVPGLPPDRHAMALRFAALFDGCPELASDGPWNKALSLPLRAAP